MWCFRSPTASRFWSAAVSLRPGPRTRFETIPPCAWPISAKRMTSSMLTVEGLQTSYGQSQVLFGVDLEVRRGEVVTVLGRHGRGKTATLRAMMGMSPPHGATITFAGRELRGLTSLRIAKLGVGLGQEGRCIFPSLTVWENLTA